MSLVSSHFRKAEETNPSCFSVFQNNLLEKADFFFFPVKLAFEGDVTGIGIELRVQKAV